MTEREKAIKKALREPIYDSEQDESMRTPVNTSAGAQQRQPQEPSEVFVRIVAWVAYSIALALMLLPGMLWGKWGWFASLALIGGHFSQILNAIKNKL